VSRLAAVLALVAALAGCIAVVGLRGAATIDDYAAVRVRVYRLGLRTCRLEVVTAIETIQTRPTVCDVVPLRTR